MNRLVYWLGIAVKRLWALVAILLVVFAVLVSVVRYSLPYLDSQKQAITHWASERFSFDVKLGDIEAGWSGLDPTIILSDLSLASEDGPLILSVPKTVVEINFWSSLRRLDLVANRFTLEGVDVYINNDASTGKTTNPQFDSLEELFLKRLNHFSLLNSNIYFTNNQRQIPILVEKLTWNNDGKRHQGQGSLKIDGVAQDSLDFILDLHDQEQGLDGTFYSKASSVDVSPWLKTLLGTPSRTLTTDANFSLWAKIKHRQLSSILLAFQPSSLHVAGAGGKAASSYVKSGVLVTKPSDDGWIFGVQDLVVANTKDEETALSVMGNYDLHDGVQLRLAKPFSVGPLISLTSLVLPSEQYEHLEKANVQMSADWFDAHINNEHFVANFRFSELSAQNAGNIPSVNRLSGTVDWSDLQGYVTLKSEQSQFNFPPYTQAPLELYELNLGAFLDVRDNNLVVRSDVLSIDTDKIRLKGNIAYDVKNEYLSAQVKLGDTDIENARPFLTEQIIGQKTADFLNTALVRGTVKQGEVLWNGRLSRFPFNKNKGVFQAATDVEGLEFNFDDRWPNVSDTNVHALFENDSLLVTADHARLLTTQGSNIRAYIDQLSAGAALEITANASDSGEGAARLVENSTLASSLGQVLSQLQLTGPITSKLDIKIPFSSEEIKVKGDIEFIDNSLFVSALKLPITGVTGQFHFENEVISAEGIQGILLAQPTQFSVSGLQKVGFYETQIKLSGHWDMAPLLTDQMPSLVPYIEGIANWRGQLDMQFPDSGLEYQFELHSDLPQLVSKFPAPLNKEAGAKQRLKISSVGDVDESSVRLVYGDDLRFTGTLSHQDVQFSDAFLVIGKAPGWQPKTQFSVAVDVPKIEIDPWYDTLFSLIGNSPGNTSLLSAPNAVTLKAGQLIVANQTFHEINATAENLPNSWLIDLTGREIRANGVVFHDLDNKGIKLDIAFLNLPEIQSGGQPTNYTDEFKLPPLLLSCAQCIVEGANLGKLDVTLTPNAQGMSIDKALWNSRFGLLNATGSWIMTPEGSKTQLKGDFNASDVGDFLKDLNQDAGIRDSGANFKFNLDWNKAPHQFEVASLNGKIDWSLNAGHLSEVSDKGARILSLFSLDSLVRKLTLDFRDVFSKGFFYNGMAGKFDVTNGIVKTTDTRIDGVAGDMTLTGYTDLNNKQINYNIGFRPKVTSSLPVIMAWLVNPATALAALAFDEVIKSAKVVSSLQYQLTGTLDKPVLSEIDRKSKEVTFPAQTNPSIETAPVPVQPTINQEQSRG